MTGFYRQDEVVSPREPMRGRTGIMVSVKAFGENFSRFYFDRHGIETVCLQHRPAVPEPG